MEPTEAENPLGEDESAASAASNAPHAVTPQGEPLAREETDTSEQSTAPPGSQSIPGSPQVPFLFSLLWGLMFALVAALMAFQPVTALTYLKLFYTGEDSQLIQHAPGEGLPVPQATVWPTSLYNLNASFGRLPSAAVLGIEVAFVCIFVYMLLRVLNPTFRMTTGVDWDKTVLTRTYMHSSPVTKAFLILIAAFLPGFLLWHLLGWLIGNGAFSLWLRLALCGMACWLLFSREGVAHDYETGHYHFPRDRSELFSLLARGAAMGTVLYLITRAFSPFAPERLFEFYHSLGYIGPGEWQSILFTTLGIAGLLGFTGGGWAAALGAPRWTTSRRTQAALLPCLGLVIALLVAWKSPFTVESHIPASERLARQVKLAPPVPQTAFLMAGERVVPLHFTGRSISELSASPESARSIERYLEKNNYRTPLSYPAYITLHDAASLQWDSTESLRVCFLNLTRSPDMGLLSLFLNKVQQSAATPEDLHYADLLADERYFAHTDRQAWVWMGDTFAHLGQSEKAQACYRKAHLPETQVPVRAQEQFAPANGRITGTLVWNGKPLPNARVGVVPREALRALQGMLESNMPLSPFWLWWVSQKATTDAKGHFTLDHLLVGGHVLVVSLPSGQPIPSRPLLAENVPMEVFIGPDRQEADLKEIKIHEVKE